MNPKFYPKLYHSGSTASETRCLFLMVLSGSSGQSCISSRHTGLCPGTQLFPSFYPSLLRHGLPRWQCTIPFIRPSISNQLDSAWKSITWMSSSRQNLVSPISLDCSRTSLWMKSIPLLIHTPNFKFSRS